jgi:cysteine-rich repeat protein
VRPALRRHGLLLVSILSIPLASGTTSAHGPAPGLEFFGNFGPAAHCQQEISSALARCFESATRSHLACAAAALRERPCEPDALAARVNVAVQRARERVARDCTDQQALTLGFASVSDAQADVADACRAQAHSSTSLVFGPAMFTGTVEPGSPRRDACLRASASSAHTMLRRAMRERAGAFDRMARVPLSLSSKEQLLSDADARIARVREMLLARLRERCDNDRFLSSYGMPEGKFFDLLTDRTACLVGASHVQGAMQCPAAECGNGVVESGEECDDGNANEDDACGRDCRKTSCESFANTFDLIQTTIFERKGCSDQLCHGGAVSGGLDLRAPQSYANLVDQVATASTLKRVEPGDRDGSFLWHKLAAATFRTEVEGSPMPSGGQPPLLEKELEAIRLWIHAGAPRNGVVEGTAALLDACLPAPAPIEIRAPEPPAPGVGVQLHMPPLEMPPRSEHEVCFATYIDVTDQVPMEARGSDGTTFRYKRQQTTQDPVSHHLVIQTYEGTYPPDDPSWGRFSCLGGRFAGQPCQATDLGACGPGAACASEVKPTVACIGFGPPDHTGLVTEFVGIQETFESTEWASGVYDEFPLRGMVIWNTHAFNLTDQPGKVEAWVNFDFALPQEQRYQVNRFIDISQVFIMAVPPFQQREYCHTFEFPRGARVFDMSSHTHRRGKLFTVFDPAGNLIYRSTQYNDPVRLVFDPPLRMDDESAAGRTYRYCSVYDNGFTNPGEVKRRSTSPPPPPPFLPVPCSATHCADGRVGEPCSGSNDAARDRSCDSTAGQGDGRCDACTVYGGVTTDDEMFILLTGYYFEP